MKATHTHNRPTHTQTLYTHTRAHIYARTLCLSFSPSPLSTPLPLPTSFSLWPHANPCTHFQMPVLCKHIILLDTSKLITWRLWYTTTTTTTTRPTAFTILCQQCATFILHLFSLTPLPVTHRFRCLTRSTKKNNIYYWFMIILCSRSLQFLRVT